MVVQQQDNGYYDDNTPDDPYNDNNSDRNYQQRQPSNQQQPADNNYDYSRPVNPDSLTYKPGTNLSSPRSNYPTRDKVWIKAHWKHTGDGWIWIDGYWK